MSYEEVVDSINYDNLFLDTFYPFQLFKLDPAIISARPFSGTESISAMRPNSSLDGLGPNSSSGSTLFPSDELDTLLNSAHGSKTVLPANPLNPEGKKYIYSIQSLLVLRESPLCITPVSLVRPDISV